MEKVYKVLILAANPRDMVSLRIDKEVRTIEEELKLNGKDHKVLITKKGAIKPEDLTRFILELSPDIVHFCGHGSTEGLFFENSDGIGRRINAQNVGTLFNSFKKTIKCVILDACFSRNQAEEIAKSIDFVIGMDNAINDEMAENFSKIFYDALGSNSSVEESFNISVSTLQMDERINPFNTPILFRRIDFQNKGVFGFDHVPNAKTYFGRDQEINQIEDWINEDHCRLIAIKGMRGTGKTSLAIKICQAEIRKMNQRIIGADNFDFVIWKSLLIATSFDDMLFELYQMLYFTHDEELFLSTQEKQEKIISFFQNKRCLLILDNFDTLLKSGMKAGQYEDDFKDYGLFLIKIAEIDHKSCVLITTREEPDEIANFQGLNKPVKSFDLLGLDNNSGRKIFEDLGNFVGTESEWDQLILFYKGNPLALELVARHIQLVFHGVIVNFLSKKRHLFKEIYDLLVWHFNRLTNQEKELLFWLAINRDYISIDELQEDLLSLSSKNSIQDTIVSLSRKIPLERSYERFSLQPVLFEFITNLIIKKASSGFLNGNSTFIEKYSLMKATSKDYIRDNQIRMIISPIIEMLLENNGNVDKVSLLIKSIIQETKEQKIIRSNYLVGNCLNILILLDVDLSNLDISSLVIWQAYLRGVSLEKVNFSSCKFSRTIFTQSFGGILSLLFNYDGKSIIASDANGVINNWNISNCEKIFALSDHLDRVDCIALGKEPFLVSGSGDETIRLWNLSTLRSKIYSGHNRLVRSVALSSDGSIIASGSEDGSIRIWDTHTDLCRKVLKGHSDSVRSLVITQNGKWLISGSEDLSIKIWDLSNCKLICSLEGHTKRVLSIDLSKDQKILASGSEDNSIILWDIENKKIIKRLLGHSNRVWSVCFNKATATEPGTPILASAGDDNFIYFWDIEKGEYISKLYGHSNRIWSIAFSQDGKLLASGSDDPIIRIWNTFTGECEKSILGYSNRIWCLSLIKNKQLLVSGSDDAIIRLWDIKTGNVQRKLMGHKNWVTSLAINPTSGILASSSDDKTIRLWNIDTGRLIHTERAHERRIRCIAYNSDGTEMVSCSDDGTVKIWKVMGERIIEKITIPCKLVVASVFSPDGKIIVSACDDNQIKIWDTSTGDLQQVFIGHKNRPSIVCFHPKKRLIASGDDDQVIKIWDIDSGKERCDLIDHKGIIRTLAFICDGKLLASAGDDRVINIWNLSSKKLIHKFFGHTQRIRALVFDEEENKLYSSGEDETIKCWNMNMASNVPERNWTILRPFSQMNINNISGVSEAERENLLNLGAIE